MQRIDFFELDRPIQERFVASAQGTAPPIPLAFRRSFLPRPVLGWSAVAVTFALGAVALASAGYGDVRSSFALQPSSVIAGYVLLGAFGLYATLRAIAAGLEAQAIPFPAAVYLFPSGVIDTRGKQLVVRPIGEIRHVNVGNRSVSVRFSDGVGFTFPVPNRARAEEIERAVGEYRTRLAGESGPVSVRDLAALDPLKDNGFSNPFSPPEPMRRPRPRFRLLAPAVAIVGGIAFGYGFFLARNALAEDALYRAARAENTLAGYREYVARGGNRSEITDILLPRAELAEAAAKKSLPALQAFASGRESSPIWPEIEAALRASLLAELQAAEREGTRSALRAFQERYGTHPLVADALERAIQAHRARVLAQFAKEAKPHAEVLEFFRRLLAYTDQHGPRVEIRFRRVLGSSVERTEKQLKKSRLFAGEASLPAQYFDAEDSEPREKRVIDALLTRLSRVFPEDVLKLEPAPALPESEADAKVTVPTLLVTHQTEMKGVYMSQKPRAAYTGISVIFEVSFRIPNDPQPYELRTSVWQVPSTRAVRNGTSFAEIYAEIADDAFTKLTDRTLGALAPGLR
ncbi:MAG: hypothetical protein DIU78_012180 [Pseudomonadota bacterium]|nr:MAG: hypothetical protein DIU78_04530 [Pseudomonadota bacterium]